MDYYVDNVEKYLEAISGDESFINAERPEHDYGILNYLIITPTTFPSILESDTEEQKLHKILRRNCRGLKYRLSDGKILALPHWKFFNIGEKEETQPDNIDTSEGFHTLSKLDGSMVHPIILGKDTSQIRLMTKMGFNDISKKVESYAFEHCKNHIELSKYLLERDMTPCFEICSPNLKIVVHYQETKLVLTEIRHNFTGKPVSVDELLKYAEKFDVPVIDVLELKSTSIQDIISEVYSMTGIEGIILRAGDRKYKLKTEWYRSRHRAISNIISEKNVIEYILNEEFDDVIAYIDEGESKNNIIRYANDLSANILSIIVDSIETARSLKDKSPKEANEFCVENNLFNKLTIMFAHANLNQGDEELRFNTYNKFIKFFSRQYTNTNRLNKNRIWIGNIKYSDYVSDFFFSMNDN